MKKWNTRRAICLLLGISILLYLSPWAFALETENIEITAGRFDGLDYGFYNYSFTVKNCTEDIINTISIDVILMDEEGNIVDTSYPQEPSRVRPGQSITISSLTDANTGAVSAIVDGYSYYFGDNEEYVKGYIDNSPTVYFSSSDDNVTNEPDITAEVENTPETSYAELKKGDKGDRVVQLQTRLTELGFYTISIDGDYGNGTTTAVEEFQEYNSLPITGIASSETQLILYSEEAKGKTNSSAETATSEKNDFNESISSDNKSAPDDMSISKTYEAYTKATNLTTEDLSTKLGNWSYKGLSLLQVDCDRINNGESVKSDALYRKMAMCLEGFSIGNNWQSFSEILIGYVPDNRENFAPFVENAISFIATEDEVNAVLQKFEAMTNSVSVTEESGSYTISIMDLTACANEMQISEEMLGYTLAMLAEHGAEVGFEGNTCILLMTPQNDPSKVALTLDTLYDNIQIKLKEQEVKLSDIQYYDGYYYFTVYTDSYGKSMFTIKVDENKEVTLIMISPSAITKEQSPNYLFALGKYISAVDTTLGDYDATSIAADCGGKTVEKNGFSYFFDNKESAAMLIERI